MNLQQLRQIEEVALNASPCLQQSLYDGWVLRFAQGQSMRANSANVLDQGVLPLPEKIAHVEQMYRAQHLPPIFRVTENSPESLLDQALAGRGYSIEIPCWVMTASNLSNVANTVAGTGLSAEVLPFDDWLANTHRLKQDTAANQALHGARLARLVSIAALGLPACDAFVPHTQAPQAHLLAVRDTTGIVGCAMGITEGVFAGIFNVVIASELRGRGLGKALMFALLERFHQAGQQQIYLQVESTNTAAIALYQGLGFSLAYRYWYRVAPSAPAKGLTC